MYMHYTTVEVDTKHSKGVGVWKNLRKFVPVGNSFRSEIVSHFSRTTLRALKFTVIGVKGAFGPKMDVIVGWPRVESLMGV